MKQFCALQIGRQVRVRSHPWRQSSVLYLTRPPEGRALIGENKGIIIGAWVFSGLPSLEWISLPLVCVQAQWFENKVTREKLSPSLSHLAVFSICVSQHVFLMMGPDTSPEAWKATKWSGDGRNIMEYTLVHTNVCRSNVESDGQNLKNFFFGS